MPLSSVKRPLRHSKYDCIALDSYPTEDRLHVKMTNFFACSIIKKFTSFYYLI